MVTLDQILKILGVGSALAGLGLVAYGLTGGPRCRFFGSCRGLAVGDSITAGGDYARFLDSELSHYEFRTVGEVGAPVDRVLANLRRELAASGPYDEIIVEAGLNSLSAGDEAVTSGLQAIVREARSSGARVLVLSLTPWSRAPDQIRRINNRLRWLAPLWGVTYVDVWTPLADESGGLRSDLTGDASMGVHPNSTGHQLMARAIREQAY